MRVEDIDHLGLIAGIVDQIGLEELVNGCLGTHVQQKVSPGQGIKAMILNGLGFVSSPLYLYEEFFVGKATEHLVGEGIAPAHLNDDYLGRLLDKVWAYGPSQLFSVVSMAAYQAFGLDSRRYHLDSSSLSVHGAYDTDNEEPGCIEITQGYSKDHRPDLKQFVVETICTNDGGVPLAFEVASGNQSDKAVFADRLKTFAEHWSVEGILVADSALYSADNLAILGSLRWITRVPLTLSAAQSVVTEISPEAFVASDRDGYRLARVCTTYGGIPQGWVVVENQTRVETDCQQVDKQVAKQLVHATKQLRRQQALEFNCDVDARRQAEALAARWPYHRLSQLEVVEEHHYAQAGRPKAGATPTRVTYRITAQIVADDAAIHRAKRKAGRFILATNAIDDDTLTDEMILSDYKGQSVSEQGFGILKDPLFFTSSVFLKTPERIAALAIIMGLSLMVYTLAQRQVRQALDQANETLLDQRKRPTQTPSLRWIFQRFQAVHLVWLDDQPQVSNLSPERLKILKFLSAPCQKYYLIC